IIDPSPHVQPNSSALVPKLLRRPPPDPVLHGSPRASALLAARPAPDRHVPYDPRRRRQVPVQLPPSSAGAWPERRLCLSLSLAVDPPSSCQPAPWPALRALPDGHPACPRDGTLSLLPQVSCGRHAALFSARAHTDWHSRGLHSYQVADAHPARAL